LTATRRIAAPLDGFLLHRYDWSETSLILDMFTRSRGRIALAAKGAKRPYSQLRSVLLPFQRVSLTVGRQADDGAAEVQTLRSAEWAGTDAAPVLPAARLFAGFYLNELLLKLLARGDPHPPLFDAYAACMRALGSTDDLGEQITLRAFELLLLKAIGLLPELDRVTATQQPLQPAAGYQLHGSRGVIEADAALRAASLTGSDLCALDTALRAEALWPLQEACAPRLERLKAVLRPLVHYHLGTPHLRTRDVMRDAQRLLSLP